MYVYVMFVVVYQEGGINSLVIHTFAIAKAGVVVQNRQRLVSECECRLLITQVSQLRLPWIWLFIILWHWMVAVVNSLFYLRIYVIDDSFFIILWNF